MSTIDIKDLANGGKLRELADKEMASIEGGQKADIGGWSSLGEVVDTVLAPIDFAAIEKWAKQQAGK
jgi:bacteriocin-like protein